MNTQTPPALAWATDIHLDHCQPERVAQFAEALKASAAPVIVLTGDLSDGSRLSQDLEALARQVEKPIYFILGNHDYYHRSMADVHAEMRELSFRSPWLKWLPAVGLVRLSATTGLIGHDSWADARHGDFINSNIWFKDYRLIEDLAVFKQQREPLKQKLHQLGDQAAAYFRELLPQALECFEQVVALMHVPPFAEAQWYQGVCYPDEPNWLPHCTCKAVGDVLLEVMSAHPDRQLLVLAGHTHHGCDIKLLPNLRVRVGDAVYGEPMIGAEL